MDFEPRREDPALDAGLGVDLPEPDREEGLEALRDIDFNEDEGSGVEGRVEDSLCDAIDIDGRQEESSDWAPGLEALGDSILPLTIVSRNGCNEGDKGSGVEGRVEASLPDLEALRDTAFKGFNGGVGGRVEASTGNAIDFDERREEGSDRMPGLEALRDSAFNGLNGNDKDSGVEGLAAIPPDVNDFDGRREDGSDRMLGIDALRDITIDAGALGVGTIKPLLPVLRKRLCAAPPGIEIPEDAFLSASDESLNSIACKRSLRAVTSSAAASKRSSLLCCSVV